MKTPQTIRNDLLQRLRTDLIGPMSADEQLADYPTDKYLTGILFPQESAIEEEEDDELAQGADEDTDEVGEDQAVPLANAKKPSSAGLSFQIAAVAGSNQKPTVLVTINAARYRPKWIGDDGKLTDDRKPGKSKLRWVREVASGTKPIAVEIKGANEPRIDLAGEGFPGLELHHQAATLQGGRAVTIVLINKASGADEREDREAQAWFQTELTVEAGAGWQIVGRLIRKSGSSRDDQTAELIYREALEYAVGHTCAATWEAVNEQPIKQVHSTWLAAQAVEPVSPNGDPVFDKIRAQDKSQVFSARWLAAAKKDELIAALNGVPDAYSTWIEREDKRIPGLPKKLQPYADYHKKLWVNGRDRMRAAVETIRKNDNARKAFQFANEAMATQRKWARQQDDLTWYPFQLAFQLLVLDSVINRKDEDRDVMDLLWFPTGGGKTEAYLGVIALLLFYRRLMAKAEEGAGICVIMRYTLRVLTTQQFERAASLICACEVLRQREKVSSDTTQFSIGLWVGSSAIPNEVAEAHSDPDERAFQIRNCPCCQQKLKKRPDTDKYAVHCDTGDCALGTAANPLPIWTVDGDVYRVLPSLLLGTVDKFAQIARKQETARLFGLNTPHAPPDLIIQDELHLISGPLGTIAGLYEIAIDEFCSSQGSRPKIIGSTATIKMAERQIRDLFNRGVYQFPPPGIDASNSCFAVANENVEGRLYVGITTAGRSAKFTLQAVCASLLQAANSKDIPEAERDAYWTLVCYFNSMRELGGAHVLMLDDVPKSMGEYAGRWGEERREIDEPAELTSRRSQAEIPIVLRELKRTAVDGNAHDVLLSTNMISVGVDIPRLALMVMNGQPKAISEYIQATSRVGRDRVPGLVLTIFNSGKPRDRSHFETFTTWHRTLYRDVEPTSVTPFAPRALDKALRAVLVSLVRHLVPGMQTAPTLGPTQRALVESKALALIERVKKVDPDEKVELENKIRIILDEWEKRGALQFYWHDYKPKQTLVMSAERVAALKAAGKNANTVWSAPNSMRDVEPDTEFRLIS